MSSFKMSNQMTSGQAIQLAVVANQLSQLATGELDKQIMYYNDNATSSSPNLTFDGSVLDIVGNVNVSDNMMVGEQGVQGSTSPQAFEFVTTNPDQVALDVHNNSVGAVNNYDFRMLFSKGATSGSGRSSLGLEGKETSFFAPLCIQPPVAPNTQPLAPPFFMDFGRFQTTTTGISQKFDVPFHTVFKSPPKVQATIEGFPPMFPIPSSQRRRFLVPYVKSTTTTGFKIELIGGGYNALWIVDWVAIGGV